MTVAAAPDRSQYVMVKIEGHGPFLIGRDLADIVARMCKAAQEMDEALHGIQVPVHLVGAGPKYILCIKFIRMLTGKNLKDAKALCDKVRDGERAFLGHFPWNQAMRIKSDGDEHSAVIEIPSPLEMLGRQAE